MLDTEGHATSQMRHHIDFTDPSDKTSHSVTVLESLGGIVDTIECWKIPKEARMIDADDTGGHFQLTGDNDFPTPCR